MDRLPDRDGYKTPAEVLDYSLDWAGWLEGDTITSSQWTADAGLTVAGNSFTSQATTVWLDGGSAQERYRATNKIITAAGRTAERAINIHIVTRR